VRDELFEIYKRQCYVENFIKYERNVPMIQLKNTSELEYLINN